MKIEVAKTDLHTALAVAGITVESSNDLSGHYLFRVKDGAVEVLTYGLRTFGRASVTPATFDGVEGDAFTVESSRLDRWMSGVSGNKTLTLQSDDHGEVTLGGERSKIRLRSLDPTKFPFWDALMDKAEDVGSVSPDSLARALACSRWFVSADDTSKPELCQVEAVDGVLWATDRRALSSVVMPRLPNLSVRIPGKDVPSIVRFLSDKRTQDEEILIRQAERPPEEGGGACAVFIRPSDGAYIGVTRPTSSFPTLKVDREEKADATFKVSRADFNSAIDILLAGAPKGHSTVTFRYDHSTDEARLVMPCEAGGEVEYRLDGAEVADGENWSTDFTIDYSYVKGIADTFSLMDIELGVNRRGKGGYVSFRHTDDDEDGQGNDYHSVIVWRT